MGEKPKALTFTKGFCNVAISKQRNFFGRITTSTTKRIGSRGEKGEIKVNNLAALFADNKTLLSDIF